MIPLLQGIPLVGGLIKTIFGSKEARDTADAQAMQSVHSQFAAEFGHGRNAFDSLIDGLNRLPRPFFAFGAMYIFFLCWSDPAKFSEGAVNLQLMPQEGWWILGTIIVFFFGGRLHKGFGKYKIKKDVLENIAAHQATLKTASTPTSENRPDPQEGIEWEERVATRYSYND